MENHIIMEKVVEDLLMIEIKVNINKDYYNYWRLTKTVGIPPFRTWCIGYRYNSL